MVDELREMQREQASQIVVPGSEAIPGGGGPMRGGHIQFT